MTLSSLRSSSLKEVGGVVTESEWFIYRSDGPPAGPVSTRSVAEAILTGELPPDCWLAAPHGKRWLRAVDVPVVANVLNGSATEKALPITTPMPAYTLTEVLEQLGQLEPPPPTMRSAGAEPSPRSEPSPSSVSPSGYFPTESGTTRMRPLPPSPSSSDPTLSARRAAAISSASAIARSRAAAP